MKKATKLLAGATVLAAVTAGMAYAASVATASPAFSPQRAASNAITATWALGSNNIDPAPAAYSHEGVFKSSTFTVTGMTYNRVRTAQSTPAINFTTVNATAQTEASENQYIEFSVTPATDFTVTGVSFAWGTIKKNDVTADVVLIADGKTKELATGVTLPKANIGADDADTDFYASYSISDFTATTGEIALRIYPYGAGREIGFANVVISGTTSSEVEPDPTPVPDDCYYHIPGTLELKTIDGVNLVAEGSLSAPRIEGVDKGIKGVNSIGYVKDGSTLTFKNVTAHKAGVYSASMVIDRRAEASMEAKIVDVATGKTEAVFSGAIPAESPWEYTFEGVVTEGKKDIVYTFSAGHTNWIINFAAPTFTLVSDKIATVTDVYCSEATATEAEGFDWAFNLPMAFDADHVTLVVDHTGGTLTAAGEGCSVSDNGDGTWKVTAPAINAEAVVTFTLAPAEGAYCPKTQYKVRLFHIGNVTLTALTVDGFEADADMIAAINADGTANLDKYVFTAMPTVTATFIDGSVVTATPGEVKDAAATYAFTGKSGNAEKNFTLAVSGIHLYTKADTDLEDKVTYDAACNQADGSWSNGLYTLSNCNDGWGGTQFKMKGNTTHTLAIPGDMKVKQLRLVKLFDNYVDGCIKSVKTSAEGAQVWLPSANTFKAKDSNPGTLVINIDGHQPGAGFEIEIEGGSQPVMWFEFVYEAVNPATAPEMTGASTTDLVGKNHAVVSFTFDRAVMDTEIEFNGTTVKAYGGGSILRFPLWDLEYSAEYTVTLPAGSVKDKYGNANETALTHTFTTGNEETAEAIAADRFVTVSNVTELRAAVAALSTTNNTAESPRTVIYMLNGDYDLGNGVVWGKNDKNEDAWVNVPGNTVVLHLNRVYNVSLIGESQEGVLIHGTLTGISTPIFSTRYSGNIYMENFTLRNDLDFGTERKGVAVAHYGGNLDVMKNVTLQSQQDTQVTGERGYYLNCTFHGTVDYICGGGDHYYDHCTFVMEGEGGVITAPSTSATLKHGYVFQNCTIKGKNKYDLGRPWQNEPRCFWLNTTMIAKSTDAGWRSMGTLPTHFYEYNSMDADGTPIDLSVRKNSPTSTNTYSPILPEEYAGYFNERNVLGSTDSWLATEYTDECEAPVATVADGVLSWNAVKGASGYIVYADGAYAGMASDPTFELTATRAAAPAYTVAAINKYGAVGKVSAPAGDSSSVSDIEAAHGVKIELYNLQGIRVADGSKGTLVRVTVAADGTRTAEKVYVK